ncbi:hypothetical protein A3H53_03625 [Candidatus Nomurabacteria bacterium RIFCSPLOWO2_02_FULL_40_10]|uniref:Uncharacterized protein n=2 Tax=Candidatus Nomuraibacteriota TaxID=1752729 RepID=A0A1F6XW17_9BACT|nr:MAG: hypothetical protein A2642_01025 [Candidatus Nomurabacteria bacterium RIFCSPHIGHO2_01_FULL_39_10]OGI98208.1 MAG: hypothetical protein A3H53_03625 [Candidatus Nomurabacteria bacterium RIFCSPLOWO2_02_FULL_40_10]
MSQFVIINGNKVEHYGNVYKGLDYLQKHAHEERIKEWFENARKAKDQDTHIEITINGKSIRYILIHTGPNEYLLKPLP